MSRRLHSKQLTQTTYGLVKSNPGMNRWTVRAAVHGAVVGGIGVLLGVVLLASGEIMEDSAGGASTIAIIAGGVVVLLGLFAGLTAANLQLAGLVKATDDVLHGREVDESAAKAAAHAQRGALMQWSAISVAVGALVSFVQGDGNGGAVTTILRSLLAGLVASVWAVVTALVLPVIVIERVGAVPAIKRSAHIIRSTWGEQVLGSIRIGARMALTFILPGFLLIAGGIALALAVGGAAMVALGAVIGLAGAVLVIIGSVKAATCRTVFGVALYRWATGGGALGPYTDEELRGAVRSNYVAAPTPVAA